MSANSSNNSSVVSLATAPESPPLSPRPSSSRPPLEPYWVPRTYCVLDHPDDIGVNVNPMDTYPTHSELQQRIWDSQRAGSTENWADLWLPDSIIAQCQRQSTDHHRHDYPAWMCRMMGTYMGEETDDLTGRHAFTAVRLFTLQQSQEIDRLNRRVNTVFERLLHYEAQINRCGNRVRLLLSLADHDFLLGLRV